MIFMLALFQMYIALLEEQLKLVLNSIALFPVVPLQLIHIVESLWHEQ